MEASGTSGGSTASSTFQHREEVIVSCSSALEENVPTESQEGDNQKAAAEERASDKSKDGTIPVPENSQIPPQGEHLDDDVVQINVAHERHQKTEKEPTSTELCLSVITTTVKHSQVRPRQEHVQIEDNSTVVEEYETIAGHSQITSPNEQTDRMNTVHEDHQEVATEKEPTSEASELAVSVVATEKEPTSEASELAVSVVATEKELSSEASELAVSVVATEKEPTSEASELAVSVVATEKELSSEASELAVSVVATEKEPTSEASELAVSVVATEKEPTSEASELAVSVVATEKEPTSEASELAVSVVATEKEPTSEASELAVSVVATEKELSSEASELAVSVVATEKEPTSEASELAVSVVATEKELSSEASELAVSVVATEKEPTSEASELAVSVVATEKEPTSEASELAVSVVATEKEPTDQMNVAHGGAFSEDLLSGKELHTSDEIFTCQKELLSEAKEITKVALSVVTITAEQSQVTDHIEGNQIEVLHTDDKIAAGDIIVGRKSQAPEGEGSFTSQKELINEPPVSVAVTIQQEHNGEDSSQVDKIHDANGKDDLEDKISCEKLTSQPEDVKPLVVTNMEDVKETTRRNESGGEDIRLKNRSHDISESEVLVTDDQNSATGGKHQSPDDIQNISDGKGVGEINVVRLNEHQSAENDEQDSTALVTTTTSQMSLHTQEEDNKVIKERYNTLVVITEQQQATEDSVVECNLKSVIGSSIECKHLTKRLKTDPADEVHSQNALTTLTEQTQTGKTTNTNAITSESLCEDDCEATKLKTQTSETNQQQPSVPIKNLVEVIQSENSNNTNNNNNNNNNVDNQIEVISSDELITESRLTNIRYDAVESKTHLIKSKHPIDTHKEILKCDNSNETSLVGCDEVITQSEYRSDVPQQRSQLSDNCSSTVTKIKRQRCSQVDDQLKQSTESADRVSNLPTSRSVKRESPEANNQLKRPKIQRNDVPPNGNNHSELEVIQHNNDIKLITDLVMDEISESVLENIKESAEEDDVSQLDEMLSLLEESDFTNCQGMWSDQSEIFTTSSYKKLIEIKEDTQTFSCLYNNNSDCAPPSPNCDLAVGRMHRYVTEAMSLSSFIHNSVPEYSERRGLLGSLLLNYSLSVGLEDFDLIKHVVTHHWEYAMRNPPSSVVVRQEMKLQFEFQLAVSFLWENSTEYGITTRDNAENIIKAFGSLDSFLSSHKTRNQTAIPLGESNQNVVSCKHRSLHSWQRLSDTIEIKQKARIPLTAEQQRQQREEAALDFILQNSMFFGVKSTQEAKAVLSDYGSLEEVVKFQEDHQKEHNSKEVQLKTIHSKVSLRSASVPSEKEEMQQKQRAAVNYILENAAFFAAHSTTEAQVVLSEYESFEELVSFQEHCRGTSFSKSKLKQPKHPKDIIHNQNDLIKNINSKQTKSSQTQSSQEEAQQRREAAINYILVNKKFFSATSTTEAESILTEYGSLEEIIKFHEDCRCRDLNNKSKQQQNTREGIIHKQSDLIRNINCKLANESQVTSSEEEARLRKEAAVSFIMENSSFFAVSSTSEAEVVYSEFGSFEELVQSHENWKGDVLPKSQPPSKDVIHKQKDLLKSINSKTAKAPSTEEEAKQRKEAAINYILENAAFFGARTAPEAESVLKEYGSLEEVVTFHEDSTTGKLQQVTEKLINNQTDDKVDLLLSVIGAGHSANDARQLLINHNGDTAKAAATALRLVESNSMTCA